MHIQLISASKPQATIFTVVHKGARKVNALYVVLSVRFLRVYFTAERALKLIKSVHIDPFYILNQHCSAIA